MTAMRCAYCYDLREYQEDFPLSTTAECFRCVEKHQEERRRGRDAIFWGTIFFVLLGIVGAVGTWALFAGPCDSWEGTVFAPPARCVEIKR